MPTNTITGLAAPFNERSLPIAGQFVEQIQPGAFAKTLRENGDVFALYDHDYGRVLGRTVPGTLRLWESSAGLEFELTPADTSLGHDAVTEIGAGLVEGVSFSFETIRDDWDVEADGVLLRTLREVKLYEISIVARPAYAQTYARMKAAPVAKRSGSLTVDAADRRLLELSRHRGTSLQLVDARLRLHELHRQRHDVALN